MPPVTSPSTALRVRLKPADPFDLIRLLARSQNDPRKAVAELVQNSLDAGATEVNVTRYRKSGAVCLSIYDNGNGVLPALDRREALRHIATNIGHSYKRNLSAEERLRQLQAGKYGIGLLGFWSVGRTFAMRSRVAGSEVVVLHLEVEKPDGSVVPEKGQKSLDPTWTEIVIRNVHPTAQRVLTGRRLAEYLGFELRGQLIDRNVRLRVVDRLARGAARQDFPVRPPRFQGVPFGELDEWPVPGQSPLRIELHYLPEEHGQGRVTLACAGTVVADDLSTLDLGAPWDSGRLTGILDAPFLDVAPGTRRGFVPNEKAEAFLVAMGGLGTKVSAWLAGFEQARAKEADQSLHRRLRQVFREIARRLPHYELFPVASRSGQPAQPDTLAEAPGTIGPQADRIAPPSEEVHPELYEPGPLASVRIVPGRCRLAVGAEKMLSARALDDFGRAIRRDLSYEWTLIGGGGGLVPEVGRALFRADAIGTARVRLRVREGAKEAEAESEIEVLEDLGGSGAEDAGIPEPVEVKDPAGRWRSRVRNGGWEFNASHPDYLMAASDPGRRFRYLATLLAKELVLRQISGGPQEDRTLECLVEVLAAIEERIGRAKR